MADSEQIEQPIEQEPDTQLEASASLEAQDGSEVASKKSRSLFAAAFKVLRRPKKATGQPQELPPDGEQLLEGVFDEPVFEKGEAGGDAMTPESTPNPDAPSAGQIEIPAEAVEQSAIDALLGNSSSVPTGETTVAIGEPVAVDAPAAVDQSAIDAMVGGSEESATMPAPPEAEGPSAFPTFDPKGLIAKALTDASAPKTAPPAPAAPVEPTAQPVAKAAAVPVPDAAPVAPSEEMPNLEDRILGPLQSQDPTDPVNKMDALFSELQAATREALAKIMSARTETEATRVQAKNELAQATNVKFDALACLEEARAAKIESAHMLNQASGIKTEAMATLEEAGRARTAADDRLKSAEAEAIRAAKEEQGRLEMEARHLMEEARRDRRKAQLELEQAISLRAESEEQRHRAESIGLRAGTEKQQQIEEFAHRLHNEAKVAAEAATADRHLALQELSHASLASEEMLRDAQSLRAQIDQENQAMLQDTKAAAEAALLDRQQALDELQRAEKQRKQAEAKAKRIVTEACTASEAAEQSKAAAELELEHARSLRLKAETLQTEPRESSATLEIQRRLRELEGEREQLADELQQSRAKRLETDEALKQARQAFEAALLAKGGRKSTASKALSIDPDRSRMERELRAAQEARAQAESALDQTRQAFKAVLQVNENLGVQGPDDLAEPLGTREEPSETVSPEPVVMVMDEESSLDERREGQGVASDDEAGVQE